jgi:glutamate N-acetyltransferase/amino-acid N-acetyltransferase
MVSIFSTGKANHTKINSVTDKKLKDFEQSLNKVLLNLAKRIVADGEGASKFITVKVFDSKTDFEAKKIAFSIANSPLVKTAIAGEDPNWGRVIMAIGKSETQIKLNKLSIKFGDISIVQKGKLSSSYNEIETAKYMKNSNIEISVNVGSGNKNFTAFTMDLTKKYIEINSDYRS